MTVRRLLALPLVAWALGFIWFAIALPQPLPLSQTDAIVVPTGSGGRIQRGLEMLQTGAAQQMLVTGVDAAVQPDEFVKEFEVPQRVMDCCVTLGFSALDTRGNARETAQWLEEREYNSLRLVTADWHMRRAALELQDQLPDDISVIHDAVRSQPSLGTLFVEYHKLIAVWLLQALG
ncbi:YdcF family protein [Aurantiacibacter rhizosphaerae]|uniref:YdcF family protein n=1 Tax=Aurantiacibacter rhizosphaerae TaxID=2691582 RepID=A0A844XGI8_9SPHN|nr:YdcF family protein [Aurantiacibacter rhizosphaerae]MWV28849.1 YdcF family protein [Aurantiacibacter rhizosphaerae]